MFNFFEYLINNTQLIFPHCHVLNMTLEVIHINQQEYHQSITCITPPINYEL
jgi:hypothetical protein